MSLFYWVAGSLVALIWISRIVDAATGVPTIEDISSSHWDSARPHGSSLSIVVPARNEEDVIADSLGRLLALDFDEYEVIAVDDRSTDRTGERMRAAASLTGKGRIRVVEIETLPDGWLGKPHAMWRAARESKSDWLLFTDADIMFKPDVMRRAIAYAESSKTDHLVLFPELTLKRGSERMVIAFFQSMFLFGHRPWKVSDPKTRDYIGVGAFNLVRRSVYEAVGTYRALRYEVLDDMKLGKIVKDAGFTQRTAFGKDLISLHWGHGAIGIIGNFTKNFFAVMSFQVWRMIGSVIAVAFINLMPFIGVLAAHGLAKLPSAAALAALTGVYFGISRRSPIPVYFVLFHPIATLLILYAMLKSMIVTLRQGGVVWRGTRYPLEELRKGMV